MTEKDPQNGFLPDDQQNSDRLFVEIPADPAPHRPDRIPSGYEPMGEVQLRGRVFRGLASGQTPWWVLIASWLLFGGFAVLMLFIATTSSFWLALLPLAIATIPLLILCRGTSAKLAHQRRRRR